MTFPANLLLNGIRAGKTTRINLFDLLAFSLISHLAWLLIYKHQNKITQNRRLRKLSGKKQRRKK